MGFPWIFHSRYNKTMAIFHIQPWEIHGIDIEKFMVYPWYSHGFSMVLDHGYSMVNLWNIFVGELINWNIFVGELINHLRKFGLEGCM